MLHIAEDIELDLIDKIVLACEAEFSLVRITKTMLDKSIIDANQSIVNLMRQSNYFDYDFSLDGEITYKPIKILSSTGWIESSTSLYRPKAKPNKQGDPRFWPKKIKQVVTKGDLLFLTVNQNNLIFIPLINELIVDKYIKEEFSGSKRSLLLDTINSNDLNSWLKKLISKMRENSNRWIESCSPTKKSPKDVGDTLEAEFGLKVNNDAKADYNGIELKTKRRLSKTPDTLFSQIPEDNLTPLKTVKNIILTYGYPSRNEKRLGYKELFVTISNKPNPQGLYLSVNGEQEIVEIRCTGNDSFNPTDHIVAGWSFELLRQRLFEKHPVTAWILASEKVIEGKFHFKYDRLEISKTPIFSQFLLLVERGIVVYDFRGGYHPDGLGRVDKGHPFRLKGAKNRKLLFGEIELIDLECE